MKRSTKSTLLSAIFMGLGQIFNREYIKGAFFAIIEVLFIANILNINDALYGLISLGDTPGARGGDHSIILMLDGLITCIVILLFIGVYALNIVDARRTSKRIDKGGKPQSAIEFIKHMWAEYFPHIMITPAFLFTVFFILLPIIFTFAVAFTNYSSPNHIPPGKLVDWVGFKNFTNLVTLDIWNTTFIDVFVWTIIFAVVTTIVNYFVGLFLALLINSKRIKLKKLWRTILILPYAIPAFISLLVMRLIFTGPGPVNNLLVMIGLERIPFFTDPMLAKIMVLVVNTWVGAPYFMVLMSGILTNIPSSLYEASEIDGATKIQQFFKITLPMVLFQTMPLLIMTFAYNFNNFGVIYLLTDGNPVNSSYKYAGSTDILISWIFKMTNDNNQFHMAAVITIILFVIVAGFSLYGFSRTKSFNEEDMM